MTLALTIFTVLAIADALTTVAVLRRGGKELNPILAPLMDTMGTVPALVIVKGGVVVLVAALVKNGLPEWALWAFNLVMLGVVIWNVAQLRRQK